MSKKVKCVVVGDGEVGKTSLLISYTTGTFSTDYIPTIFDTMTVNVIVNHFQIDFNLWDTAGQGEYDRLRPLAYPDTDVFIICFSLVNKVSFSNVKSKWYEELMHFRRDIPIVIVGTKLDLRNEMKSEVNNDKSDHKNNIVSRKEGLSLTKDIKGVIYIESSCITQVGVKEVFDEAIKAALGYKKPVKEHCSLL